MIDVKAQCRVCGGYAPSAQFKLHHTYKKMVCPNCYSGKTKQLEEKKKEEPMRPPGWDAEDDYLEKASAKKKQEHQVMFTKISGTDLVQCTCAGCKYQFKYDPYKKLPYACPYCNMEVPKPKSFSLF